MFVKFLSPQYTVTGHVSKYKKYVTLALDLTKSKLTTLR
jgi:hypothetical protein